MSHWRFALAFSLTVIPAGSVLAQDGRGSKGGSPRRVYPNSTYTAPSDYRYLYPGTVVVAPVPMNPVPAATAVPVAPAQAAATPSAAVDLSLAPAATGAALSSAASGVSSLPARVSVQAPDGAQVWFDGAKSDLKEGSSVFTTAPIETGRTAKVSVKIEWGGGSREMQLVMQSGDAMTIHVRGMP